MKGKIVLEEHLSTALNNSLWDAGSEAARNGIAYMDDVESRLLDVDRRLEEMDRNGIDIAIISLTSPGAQSIIDPREAVEFARKTNDEINENFMSLAPRRLRAFATVALHQVGAAVIENGKKVTDYNREVFVLRKIDGTWKIVLYTFNTDPKQGEGWSPTSLCAYVGAYF